MKNTFTNLLLCAGIVSGSMFAQTVTTGPSSSQSPYILPLIPGYSVTSILTTPDIIGGYKMCGIPDGLGAYDNNDGTFTLFMNHEIAIPSGTIRAHGSNGAFVSKWIINKTTLAVVSGNDLMQNVMLWNPTASTYSLYNATNASTLTAFSRFCSADLPAVTSYYNSTTGKGTQTRIFMDGEESGNEGRLLGHIGSGSNAGTSYELPFLGKFSCENAVACPYRSDKTIVAGMDDSTPGQVYIYVGNKSTVGNEITKAGLTGGTLYGIAVSGMVAETNSVVPSPNTTFSLIPLPNVQAITGTSLNTLSNNLGVTTFLRPEDGAWDPANPRDLYFNTTNAFSSPSRLWRVRFTDIENPQLGGTITAVLDGTEGQQMLDNMTIDYSGHILLCEDVGNNAYIGRVLEYNIATDVLTPIYQHDPSRFVSGGSNYLTQDEETSGILDVQPILGPGKFLVVSQAHYAISGDAVEGGQLMLLSSVTTATTNPEINVQGNTVNIPAGQTAVSVGNNTDFGMININTTLSKSFVIQNTGTGPLLITGINFSGANAGDFTLVSPPSFPLTIPASGSQNITVKYGPVLPGTSAATLNIYNNDFNESIYDYALNGVGAAPEIDVLGNSLSIAAGTSVTSTSNNTDFGSIYVNNLITKTFVIQNTGNGTLTVSGITVAGANASEFTLVSPPTFPLNMNGSTSQTISVQFLPVASGTRTAKLVIANTDSNESSYDFVVQGVSLSDVGISSVDKTTDKIQVFPNPANNEATIVFTLNTPEHVAVRVIDLLGRNVMQVEKNLGKGEQSVLLNTSTLSKGEYFLKVTSGNKTQTTKLLVEH